MHLIYYPIQNQHSIKHQLILSRCPNWKLSPISLPHHAPHPVLDQVYPSFTQYFFPSSPLLPLLPWSPSSHHPPLEWNADSAQGLRLGMRWQRKRDKGAQGLSLTQVHKVIRGRVTSEEEDEPMLANCANPLLLGISCWVASSAWNFFFFQSTDKI